MKTVDGELCGLSKITGTLFLGKCVYFCSKSSNVVSSINFLYQTVGRNLKTWTQTIQTMCMERCHYKKVTLKAYRGLV